MIELPQMSLFDMLHPVHVAASVLLWLWGFWVLYVVMMGCYRAKLAGRLKGLNFIMAGPFLAAAFVLDFVMQMTVFTLVFAELPRHWLVTNRLRAYIAQGSGWRCRWAEYLCRHLLDRFDPTGAHCDSDPPSLA